MRHRRFPTKDSQRAHREDPDAENPAHPDPMHLPSWPDQRQRQSVVSAGHGPPAAAQLGRSHGARRPHRAANPRESQEGLRSDDVEAAVKAAED